MSNVVKLLDGRELVECGNKHQALPTKGPKCSIYNGSWLEQKQIESALDDRKNALQLQRIEKVGSLSQAVWLEDKCKAHVTDKKGPYWLHMGHTEDQNLYIYPEEIIHLLEMNSLDLKYGGVRMSLQQAYSKFIGSHISMDEYRVYSNLSRQGYKLIRHNPFVVYCNTSGTNSEDELNVCSKEQVREGNVEADVMVSDSSEDDCMMVTDTTKIKEKTRNDVMLVDSDESSDGTDVVCLPSFSLKCKILLSIPNCYNKRFIVLDNPESKYLPHGINLSKRRYGISMEKLMDQPSTSQDNREQILNNRLMFQLPEHNFQSRFNNTFNNNNFFYSIMQNLLKIKDNITNRDPGKSEVKMVTENKEKTLQRCQVQSKKQQVLQEIQSLLQSFSAVTLENKSSVIKEALILAIIKFNDMFEERYTLVFRDNKCILKKMPDDEAEHQETPVLLLSSDSDSPPHKFPRKSFEQGRCSPQRKRRTKRKEKISNAHSSSVDITTSSDEENVIHREQLPTASLESSIIQHNVHQRWFNKDSWGKPEMGKSKRKDNYIAGVGSKIAFAVLESIKDLSYKKDCPIESWSQGKQLYKDKIIANAVYISDDDVSDGGEENASAAELDSSLLCKEDCISIETIMKKLSIIKSPEDEISYKNNKDYTLFKISYDMYMPTDKALRKSELPPPVFSIIVISDKTNLPTSLQLSRMRKTLHEDVSILYAIVSFDTISYIEIENILLPHMIRKNDNKH